MVKACDRMGNVDSTAAMSKFEIDATPPVPVLLAQLRGMRCVALFRFEGWRRTCVSENTVLKCGRLGQARGTRSLSLLDVCLGHRISLGRELRATSVRG